LKRDLLLECPPTLQIYYVDLALFRYNVNMSYLALPVLVVGWVAGLGVNYLADVLPRTRRFSRPVCHRCGQPWTSRAYLLMQPHLCGARRSLRTWIVQAVFLAVAIALWLNPPKGLGFGLGLLLLTYLGVIFVIDLEERLILHPVSLTGIVLGGGIGLYLHGWRATLLGGLAGFGIMFFFYLLGLAFTRLRARRMRAAGLEPDDEEALGFGDVALSTVLGLTLGWPLIWFGLLLGILAGGAVSLLIVLILLIVRRYRKNALMVFIPYGPYFVLSTILLLYLPNWIVQAVPK
jgi:hypothetical protein